MANRIAIITDKRDVTRIRAVTTLAVSGGKISAQTEVRNLEDEHVEWQLSHASPLLIGPPLDQDVVWLDVAVDVVEVEKELRPWMM